MLKLVFLFWSYLVLLNSQGSFGDSQDNNRSVCLLTDPSNQCGQFCLSKLHPMIDLIPETNIKLSGIQGEQLSTQMKLVAVQSRLEAQRIQIQNFIKMIPTKEDFESGFNGTAGQLMAVNSELKNQLLGLQSKMEDQHTEIQESFKKTSTQEDLEVVLNRTQEQAVLIDLELKNQHLILQKGLEDRMQILLNVQLGEVRTTLNDQKEALYDYFKSEMEGQLMTVKSEMKNQQAELQESFKKTSTQEDFEVVLNRTQEQAVLIDLELKNQHLILQKGLEDRMQILLDVQLGEVRTTLNDQKKALYDYFKSEMEGQLVAVKSEMKNQQAELQESYKKTQVDIEVRMNQKEEQLLLLQTTTEDRHLEIKSALQDLLAKLENQQKSLQENLLKTLSTTKVQVIPPKFEEIGTEYYYIERTKGHNWREASSICRQMGGFLASFQNIQEIEAIIPKLFRHKIYWVGSSDLKYEGLFISEASGEQERFINWGEGEPNNKNDEDCVVLTSDGLMNDHSCSVEFDFICKAVI